MTAIGKESGRGNGIDGRVRRGRVVALGMISSLWVNQKKNSGAFILVHRGMVSWSKMPFSASISRSRRHPTQGVSKHSSWAAVGELRSAWIRTQVVSLQLGRRCSKCRSAKVSVRLVLSHPKQRSLSHPRPPPQDLMLTRLSSAWLDDLNQPTKYLTTFFIKVLLKNILDAATAVAQQDSDFLMLPTVVV